MELKERLLPIILESDLSFKQVSSKLGISQEKLYEKIESNNLNTKDAYLLSELLRIKNPTKVFFLKNTTRFIFFFKSRMEKNGN